VVSATGVREAKQKTREKQMNDIYISRMMQNISVTLAEATQEILTLRKENEKLKKLLGFTMLKSGDVNAEQSA
jgi:cell shape-determining protein MreC